MDKSLLLIESFYRNTSQNISSDCDIVTSCSGETQQIYTLLYWNGHAQRYSQILQLYDNGSITDNQETRHDIMGPDAACVFYETECVGVIKGTFMLLAGKLHF